MKNYNFMNNIFYNSGYLTQKNPIPNKIEKFVELTTSSININITSFDGINRRFRRRNKFSFYPIGSNFHNMNQSFTNNFKLYPVRKIKLFENKELENITFDVVDVNNNNPNNTKKFKKTLNQSSQSDFYFNEDDLETKIKKKHYIKINELLSKKMPIRIYKPKLKKINFNVKKEKNILLENLLKSKNNEILRKHLNINLKPLKYYSKSLNKNRNEDIKSNELNFNTRNNSLRIPKLEAFEKDNNYEVIKSIDKRNTIIYANKLIINDTENDNINKEDETNNLFLKKRNDKMISSYTELLHLGNKYKYINRNKRQKKIKLIPYDDIKKLSKRGFENLMSQKHINFSKKLHNAKNKVGILKQRFHNYMEDKRQIFEKKKDEALNDNIINDY